MNLQRYSRIRSPNWTRQLDRTPENDLEVYYFLCYNGNYVCFIEYRIRELLFSDSVKFVPIITKFRQSYFWCCG